MLRPQGMMTATDFESIRKQDVVMIEFLVTKRPLADDAFIIDFCLQAIILLIRSRV